MHIALIGATGGTGRHLIDLALQNGHRVTALARTPSKLEDVASRIEVRKADGRDRDSLYAALDGPFDAVVTIVGASGLLEARKVTDLYSVSATNLIDAMEARGLNRLIAVSSSGVEPQENDGWFYVNVLKRFFLNPMYGDMQRMESRIQASPLDYTIVRPPYLTKGDATGTYRIRKGGNLPDDGSLRRGDLAHFLRETIETPEPYSRMVVAVSE
ncbi:MAG: NAD(P)H-binding protein [Bacteroidota bacterium]